MGDEHNVMMAKAWIRDQVRKVGLGFHIDTPYEDYVDENGEPIYNKFKAREWDVSLDIACTILKQHNIDPYEVALKAMKELQAE